MFKENGRIRWKEKQAAAALPLLLFKLLALLKSLKVESRLVFVKVTNNKDCCNKVTLLKSLRLNLQES